MKNSQPSLRENTEGELRHYLHERPNLLLKMLDIAEGCWQESKEPVVGHVLHDRAA